MEDKPFSGVVPALLTPFDGGEEVDYAALVAHIARLLENGIDGLFVCGTTGLWWLLSEQERMRIVEATVASCDGSIPIMVHVGSLTTRSSVRLAQHAQQCGARAISALPPVGFPYPVDAIWAYFREIAESCELPLYLYHLPQLFGDLITMDKFIAALETIPTLAGVKFSAYQIDHLLELKIKSHGRLNILSGGAEQLLSAVSCGAEGSVCSWYNFFPRLARQIMDCVEADDLSEASRLQDLLIRAVIDIRGMGQDMLWRLVAEQGIGVGRPRKPLPRISDETYRSALSELRECGIFDWCI